MELFRGLVLVGEDGLELSISIGQLSNEVGDILGQSSLESCLVLAPFGHVLLEKDVVEGE